MSLPDQTVLHVVERCRGGVATYVAEAMRAQRASGRWASVDLLADRHYLEPELAAAADRLLDYRSARRIAGMARAAWQVTRRIRKARPSVVHLHSSCPGVYGRVAADSRAIGPAILYCAHGWAFEMQTAKLKRGIYRTIERELAHKADVIVSISAHEFAAAEAAGIRHGGHIAIPHGARPATPGPRPEAMDPTCLNLLFVGRLDRQKGLDLLLRAFRQAKRQDIRLHVIGAEGLGDGAHVQIADPRLKLYGWIAHDSLDAWYAAADAIVMPSRWEGFGLVAIEAMRNGTPVLASDRGALPEVLDGGAAGILFDPENTAGLANLIETLDRDTLRSLGAAAYARYQSAYTADRAATALAAAYDLAIERRQGRG